MNYDTIKTIDLKIILGESFKNISSIWNSD